MEVSNCNCVTCINAHADYAAQEKMKAAAAGAVQGTSSVYVQSERRARLQRDIFNLNEQLQRSARAADILRRHPEFEEFIELLGLIRVEIRQTPLQAEKALVLE